MMNSPLNMPHSITAEQMVIGTVLVKPTTLKSATGVIDPEDLYASSHREIFSALISLSAKSENLDLEFVVQEMKRNGTFEAAGGLSYLMLLANQAGAGGADVKAYSEEILRLSMLRDVIRESKNTMEEASSEPEDPSSFIFKKIENLNRISKRKKIDNIASAKELCENYQDGLSFMEVVEKKQELYETHGEDALYLDKLPTGFPKLDKMICGLEKQMLYILACRPRTGKTALSLNIMLHVAKMGHPCVFVSTEMPRKQLQQRLILGQAGVDRFSFESGRINGDEYQRINQAWKEIMELDIYFIDNSEPSVGLVRSRVAHTVENLGVKCAFIDYLQRIKGNGKKENRQVEVAEVSSGMKSLCVEMDIPVFCAAQLNRGIEADNRAPRLSDLRESGQIEQDADYIMFLSRQDLKDVETSKEEPHYPGYAQLEVSKNRHGETGIVPLNFIPHRMLFTPGLSIREHMDQINGK